MHRVDVPRILFSACIVSLLACGSDGTQPATQNGSATPASMPSILAAADGTCGPPTQPGGSIIETATTPPAWGIAVRDDGLTYFTEPFHNGLGITNTFTRTVEGFIPTGGRPLSVTFSPDGASAYVANTDSRNVGVINVATAQQVTTIPMPAGEEPLVVRVSPDGSRLFIATVGTTVYIVDTQTREVVGSVPVGFLPNAFAVHPDGRIMYASAAFGGTVTEFDMFTGSVLRTFTVGGRPQDMAVTRNGKRLYVGNEAGFLNEINLETGAETGRIALAGGAFGIGITPNDNQAYVGIPSAGVVQVFNLQSQRLSFTIDVGGDPRRIAFSQRGHIGAIANLNGYVTFVR